MHLRPYYYLAVGIFSLTEMTSYGQGMLSKKALDNEQMNHFMDASYVYQGLYKRGNREASLQAARNFYKSGKYEQALELYEYADSLKMISDAEEVFRYFECLKWEKRYEEADVLVKSRIKEFSDRPEFRLHDEKLDYYKQLSNYKGVELKPLGLNTKYSDISPTMYEGLLYFVSTRPATGNHKVHRINMQPFYNLYAVSPDGEQKEVLSPVGVFGKPQGMIKAAGKEVKSLPAGINKEYHDGPIQVAPSGKILFFTSNYSKEKRPKEYAHRINLMIYYSENQGGTWTEPQGIPTNSFEYSNQHGYYDEKSSTLYFASNRPGGKGGYDIWKSKRNSDGSWTEAVNLGEGVNTTKSEVFPSLTPDNQLLFASNGWPGLGGLDVFLSDGKSKEPLNLMAGINSEKDDFGMYFTGDKGGYLSSSRSGSVGDDDIWQFNVNMKEVLVASSGSTKVNVAIRYQGSTAPKGADIEVKTSESTKLYDAAGTGNTTQVSAGKDAVITARARGFEPASIALDNLNSGNNGLDLALKAMANESGLPGDEKSLTTGNGNIFSETFERGSFENFNGELNGGTAEITRSSTGDRDLTLGEGQRLETLSNNYSFGTYEVSARSGEDNAAQSIEAFTNETGKQGYVLEVRPEGSKQEGWSLSYGGQRLTGGSDVMVRVGEWYKLKLDIQSDSVISLINGKRIGAVKNVASDTSEGTAALRSTGGMSQFDELLIKTESSASGTLVLNPVTENEPKIAEAVKTGTVSKNITLNPSSNNIMSEESILAGGLEQIRREQEFYKSGLDNSATTAVTSVNGNSTADELGSFEYKGEIYVLTNRSEEGQGATSTSVTGNQSASGSSATATSSLSSYRIGRLTTAGSLVWAAGRFGEEINLSGNNNSTTGITNNLPAGTEGNSYSGSAVLSSAGNWMVITDNKGRLSYSVYDGKKWGMPLAFPYDRSATSEIAGGASATNREGYFDEKTSTLYFSSSRSGGFGGYDIWSSVWSAGSWSVPVNLGPMVNSRGDEVTPFINNNGDLMYSSNGWSGFGGYDVFVWRMGMTGPVNMLGGVNTKWDDLGARIMLNGQGYVSSNRNGSRGGFDLYKFRADAARIMTRHGLIKDGVKPTSSSGDLIAYGTVVGELGEREGLSDIQVVDDGMTPAVKYYRVVAGRLVTTRDVNKKDDRLRKVTVRGRTKTGREVVRVIEVWPAAPEVVKAASTETIVMKSDKVSSPAKSVTVSKPEDLLLTLYYASGRIGFRRISFGEANRLVRILRSEPGTSVKIDVFTDCSGSEETNLKISDRRAKWLVSYLNRRVPGSASRITATGQGETNPAVDCNCDRSSVSVVCTTTQKNSNRRAEVRREQ